MNIIKNKLNNILYKYKKKNKNLISNIKNIQFKKFNYKIK